MDASDDLDTLSRDELLLLVRELLQVNQEQQARIRWLEQEVQRLSGGGPSEPPIPRQPPDFVKPNRAPREKKPRKRRPHGFARKRQTPTRVVEHAPEACSVCGRKLTGGWVHARRQVMEIPPTPVEVIEHRFVARYCGVCHRREVARPDLSGQVVGQSRLGVGLMSLLAYLDTVCRLPLPTIQALLWQVYGLRLSQGALVRTLHTVAEAGQSTYQALLAQVRQSPVVQADETGAREDGLNGYVWSLSTPAVRFYHRDGSRASAVVQQLLGHDPAVYQARSGRAVRAAKAAASESGGGEGGGAVGFRGTLVSDFYTGYSWYLGSHQRCLVHLDRDMDALKAAHAKEPSVCAWVEAVLALVERAKTYARKQRERPQAEWTGGRRERRAQRRVFEQEAEALARPYVHSALPQRVLSERLLRHLGELFVFVEHLDVPADNNAAERAIRPFVVVRKVSGGTRSPAGSQTQAVLLSLFGTWQLRGQSLLASCQQMLGGGAVAAPT